MNTMAEGRRCLYPRSCHLHEVSISSSNTEIAPGPLLRPLALIFTYARKFCIHNLYDCINILIAPTFLQLTAMTKTGIPEPFAVFPTNVCLPRHTLMGSYFLGYLSAFLSIYFMITDTNRVK